MPNVVPTLGNIIIDECVEMTKEDFDKVMEYFEGRELKRGKDVKRDKA